MPFYLVSHTALTEADDEVGAAQQVLAKLQHEQQVDFTVKFDEQTVSYISVSRDAVDSIKLGTEDRNFGCLDESITRSEQAEAEITKTGNEKSMKANSFSIYYIFCAVLCSFGLGVCFAIFF